MDAMDGQSCMAGRWGVDFGASPFFCLCDCTVNPQGIMHAPVCETRYLSGDPQARAPPCVYESSLLQEAAARLEAHRDHSSCLGMLVKLTQPAWCLSSPILCTHQDAVYLCNTAASELYFQLPCASSAVAT